jgi:hypothetical protein
MPGHVSRVTSVCVLAGVPLVAIGITTTRFNGPVLLECVAALVMAAGGMGVAWMHLRLADRPGAVLVRLLWSVAGTALLFGMGLAALYGVRFSAPSDCWLTVPWMRALHGSANVFGFGLMALVGWWLSRLGEPSTESGEVRSRGAEVSQRATGQT